MVWRREVFVCRAASGIGGFHPFIVVRSVAHRPGLLFRRFGNRENLVSSCRTTPRWVSGGSDVVPDVTDIFILRTFSVALPVQWQRGSAVHSEDVSAARPMAGTVVRLMAGSVVGSMAGSSVRSMAGIAARSMAGSAVGSVSGSSLCSVIGNAVGSVIGSTVYLAGSVAVRSKAVSTIRTAQLGSDN